MIQWLGPDSSQMDEEQNELDDLIRALHESAKALAELQRALQRVRTTLNESNRSRRGWHGGSNRLTLSYP